METTANAPAGTGQAMTVPLNAQDARCGALFVSGLDRSDAPTAGRVTESISRAMGRFGTPGPSWPSLRCPAIAPKTTLLTDEGT